MSTPDPYTSARFRTDRDALGVSVDFIARRLDLADVTVWKYQAPNRTDPLPERVRDLMDELDATREQLVRELAARPTVFRPRDDDEAADLYPAVAGWGSHALGLILAAAVERRASRGQSAAIEWTAEVTA